MGMFNRQKSTPVNNNTTQLNNLQSISMPGMPNLTPQFMNFPNQFVPMQNNHLGVPQLGPANVLYPSQSFVGFGQQGNLPNLNNIAAFNMQRPFGNFVPNGNQMNLSQLPGQLFPQNMSILPQHINQNMGVTNGQFLVQTPMQNMNQLVPMQMSNPSQFGPYNVSSMHQILGCLNQVSQAMGPQNATFVANPQFGLVNSSETGRGINQKQTNLVQPSKGMNALPSNITQHVQGNLPLPFNGNPPKWQQAQENLPPSDLSRSQGIHVNGGNNASNSKWGNSPSKNVKRNQKNDRFQKSQFHHMKNAKKNFRGFKENSKKGVSNDRRANHDFTNSIDQAKQPQKRSLSLNYTDQEIQQWRDQRRKNYPSKSNIQKKLTENPTNSEVIVREAKLRREQLKEILTKQAELGVEVAEVPSHYLSDSENQPHGRKEDHKRALTKREKFQNKGKKRRRYDKRGRLSKDQNPGDKNSSSEPSVNIRKPTLLEKLLSADIRRDRSYLFQVFRFMVINSFFKDQPEMPLKFPLTLVQDSGNAFDPLQYPAMVGASSKGPSFKDSICEDKVIEPKSLLIKEGSFKVIDETAEDDSDTDDVVDDVDKGQGGEEVYSINGNGGRGAKIAVPMDDEEGEIIE